MADAYVKIDARLDSKDFMTDAKQLTSAIKAFKTETARIGKDIQSSAMGYGTAMRDLANATKYANQHIRGMQAEANRLSATIDRFAGKKIETQQYRNLKNEIGKAKEEMAKLSEKRAMMDKMGTSMSKPYQQVLKDMASLSRQMDLIKNKAVQNRDEAYAYGKELRTGINSKTGNALSQREMDARRTYIRKLTTENDMLIKEYHGLDFAFKELQTDQASMRSSGEWMSAPYKTLMYNLTQTRKRMRDMIDEKHKMEAQGHGSQFVYGEETEEFKQMEARERELLRLIQEIQKEKEKAFKPPYMQSWEKMVTLTGLIKEGFGRIQNAAAGVGYAISHPAQALNRALGFVVQKAGQVTVALAKMAGKAALSFLKNLASTAANAAIQLAKLAGNAVLSGLRRIATLAKDAALSLARMASGAVMAAFGRIGTAARNAAANVAGIGKGAVKKAIGGLGSLAVQCGKALLGIGKNARRSNKGLGASFKMVLKYAFGIRSLYFLFRRLRQAVTEGLAAIAKRDPALKASLNSLKKSLNALKGSLASAFAPIVTAIAPALTKLMDMLTGAINTVGAFMAALTGKTTYQKSIGAIGESADKSSKSVKDLNRQLASFDELNILSDKNNTSNTDNSGFAYETATIESGITDFVKQLKELWDKADFEGLGVLIASKINSAFEKAKNAISWANLGNKITQIINGITGIFNGLVDGINWTLIGQTFGEGINTLVKSWNKLMDNIRWENLGEKLAEGLNGLVDTVDWDELGKAFTKKINAIFDTLYGLVSNFKWGNAGTAFGRAVNSFVNNVNWTTIGNALSTGIKGALNMLRNAIGTFDAGSLAKNLQEGLAAIDWVGIANALGKGINTLVLKVREFVGNLDASGIVDPFIIGINTLNNRIKWGELGQTVGEGFNEFVNIVNGFFSGIQWYSIGSNLVSAINTSILAIDWNELGAMLSEKAGALVSFIRGAVENFSFGNAGDALAETINGFFSNDYLWTDAGIAIDKAIKGLLNFTNRFVITFDAESAANRIREALGWIDWDSITSKFWTTVTNAFKKAGSLLDALLGVNESNLFGGAAKKINARNKAWDDLANSLADGFNTAVDKLTELIKITDVKGVSTAVFTWLLKCLNNVDYDKLGTLAGSFLQKALDAIGPAIATAAANAKTMGDNIATFLNNALREIDWDSNSSTSVKMIIENGFKGAIGLVTGFFEKFDEKEFATQLKSALTGVKWGEIAQGIWDALALALSKLGSFITVLFGDETYDSNVSRMFRDKGVFAESNASALAKSMSNLATSILNAIKEAFGKIPWEEWGNNVHEFLLDIKWLDIATAFWNAIVEAAKGLGTTIITALFGRSDNTKEKMLTIIASSQALVKSGKYTAEEIYGAYSVDPNMSDSELKELAKALNVNTDALDANTSMTAEQEEAWNRFNKSAYTTEDDGLSGESWVPGKGKSAAQLFQEGAEGTDPMWRKETTEELIAMGKDLLEQGYTTDEIANMLQLTREQTDTLRQFEKQFNQGPFGKIGDALYGLYKSVIPGASAEEDNGMIQRAQSQSSANTKSLMTDEELKNTGLMLQAMGYSIDKIVNALAQTDRQAYVLRKALEANSKKTDDNTKTTDKNAGFQTVQIGTNAEFQADWKEQFGDGFEVDANVNFQPNVAGGSAYRNNGLLGYLKQLFAPGTDTQTRVTLVKHLWDTVYGFVNQFSGGNVGKFVDLLSNFGSTVLSWVNGRSGGNAQKWVDLLSNFGSTVLGWVNGRSGGNVQKWVDLISNFGGSVLDWINNGKSGGNAQKLVDLVSNFGSTVLDWIDQPSRKGGPTGVLVDLLRTWITVSGWVNDNRGTNPVNQNVGLIKSWATVAGWILASFMGGDVEKFVGLTNSEWGSGWTSVMAWVADHMGTGDINAFIGLLISGGYNYVVDWINKHLGGNATAGVDLTNSGTNWAKGIVWFLTKGKDIILGVSLAIKSVSGAVASIVNAILGKAEGGIVTAMGRSLAFASGGVISGGMARFLEGVPHYARGTTRAHGTLFVAGEAGPEIMGHINGRTEILNKSQLAQTMYGAVTSGMAAALRGLTFRMPAMATGGVMPYEVSAQIARTGLELQSTLDANNEDLIQTIISVIGAQTTAIVAALQAVERSAGGSGGALGVQGVINEINRRTQMFSASPLKGV